ncbi:MAG: NAD-dependent epimerase/dehydratase family protein [Lachnospiraceae bacterium]|nr:NAD-dependent epimerase/dehydratase family protein [Lachnospiraceae bacterium]
MKRILITGKSSYIGRSLEKWLLKYPDCYFCERISIKNKEWHQIDFSGFDVVFHVAGLVHVKETNQNKVQYDAVNRDLTYEVANKAKRAGVKQFVFLSSMSVYGLEIGKITADVQPKPKSHYGKSKLAAEKRLNRLEDVHFKMVIVRPPMVYGKGCKGNYATLFRFACCTPIFPEIENRRSMIHIVNLCEFIRILIDQDRSGTFFPQDKDYVKTCDMVQLIGQAHGKNIKLIKIPKRMVGLMFRAPGKIATIFTKVFGSLIYDKEMSEIGVDYRVWK